MLDGYVVAEGLEVFYAAEFEEAFGLEAAEGFFLVDAFVGFADGPGGGFEEALLVIGGETERFKKRSIQIRSQMTLMMTTRRNDRPLKPLPCLHHPSYTQIGRLPT